MLTLTTPGLAQTDSSGPLAVGDLFPARRGFLQVGPEPTATLAAGDWQIDVLASVGNTLARSTAIEVALEARSDREPVTLDFLRRFNGDQGVFFIDGEDHSLRLRIDRGLGRGWQVGLELPFVVAGDGSLDGLAEDFHSLLGVDQDGRLGIDKNRYLVFVAAGEEEFVSSTAPGSGLGDLTIHAKRRLRPWRRWERGFSAALKVPTGDEKRLLGSGSIDLAARLLTSRGFGRWHLHGGVGLAQLDHWNAVGIPSQLQFSAFAAVERVQRSGGSTVLQLVAIESPLERLGVAELDEHSYQLTLGSHIRLTPRHRLTLAITENVLHFDSGSDFVLHAGVSTTMRRRSGPAEP